MVKSRWRCTSSGIAHTLHIMLVSNAHSNIYVRLSNKRKRWMINTNILHASWGLNGMTTHLDVQQWQQSLKLCHGETTPKLWLIRTKLTQLRIVVRVFYTISYFSNLSLQFFLKISKGDILPSFSLWKTRFATIIGYSKFTTRKHSRIEIISMFPLPFIDHTPYWL